MELIREGGLVLVVTSGSELSSKGMERALGEWLAVDIISQPSKGEQKLFLGF